MAQKYFEDIEEGYTLATGSREITQEMINDFAVYFFVGVGAYPKQKAGPGPAFCLI